MVFRLKLMFSLFAENPKQNSKPKYHLMKGRINEFVRQIRCNILQMKNIDFHNLPLFLQLIGRIGFAAFRPFCTLFTPGCHPFRSSCVHCLRPLVSPCGSQCGSEVFDLLQELRQHIENNGADHDPVGVLVVVDQPVPQAGNFNPRDFWM